jgi:hypothetical protein
MFTHGEALHENRLPGTYRPTRPLRIAEIVRDALNTYERLEKVMERHDDGNYERNIGF